MSSFKELLSAIVDLQDRVTELEKKFETEKHALDYLVKPYVEENELVLKEELFDYNCL
jgi:hypothetical protein